LPPESGYFLHASDLFWDAVSADESLQFAKRGAGGNEKLAPMIGLVVFSRRILSLC